MASVLRQPASLTLWTYLELQDQDRIASLLERSARYEGAGLTAVASWNGKEFSRMQASFRAGLSVHPDPAVEQRRREDALRESLALIELVESSGKGPRRALPAET